MRPDVIIIGGGLAGSEAAWQLAKRGVQVRLYEMRPKVSTPAHKTGNLAELVCSNSFRASDPLNAVGLLKEELRCLDSLIMQAADQHRVPAGGAHAVDREPFARLITETLASHDSIEVVHDEVTSLDTSVPCMIATGPLTSSKLAEHLSAILGQERLYFFDAIAPIIEADSIDLDKVFKASRYAKGDSDDYINCPMNKPEYQAFIAALLQAENVPFHEFEKDIPYFEACLPIEEMAERGEDTLRFGPMKPVGLRNPKTGQRPYAVVQLRQENAFASLYNMVGFQTKLKYPEQKRIFHMIPGLENAVFHRLGSLHKNTYINSPRVLGPQLQAKINSNLFFAGQITGVEGYVESTAVGLMAALYMWGEVTDRIVAAPPASTATGSLLRFLREADAQHFQPMKINFGLFPEVQGRRDERKQRRLAQARYDLLQWMQSSSISAPTYLQDQKNHINDQGVRICHS